MAKQTNIFKTVNHFHGKKPAECPSVDVLVVVKCMERIMWYRQRQITGRYYSDCEVLCGLAGCVVYINVKFGLCV